MSYEYNVVYKINDIMTAHYVGDIDGSPCFSSLSPAHFHKKDGFDFKVERLCDFDEHLRGESWDFYSGVMTKK